MARTENTNTAMTVKSMWTNHITDIAKVIPANINADRIIRSAIEAIRRNEALSRCAPESLFLAVVQAGMLGLELNTPMGLAYLVPYKGECTLIPGYRGLIDLSRRTGSVGLFYADYICERDEWKQTRGAHPDLQHEIKSISDRGDVIAYYAVFHHRDNWFDFEVLSMDDIGRVAAMSKASRDDAPWKIWPEEMAKKTAIRRLAKRVPMSVELARAMALDAQAATGETQTGMAEDFIEVSGFTVGDADEPAPKTATKPKVDIRAALIEAGAGEADVDAWLATVTPLEQSAMGAAGAKQAFGRWLDSQEG